MVRSQLEALPHHRMPGILLGDDLRAWMDPNTEEPEKALHATPETEIEAVTVEAKRFRELVEV
jgi:putative SOS response-associated peptidase YedK